MADAQAAAESVPAAAAGLTLLAGITGTVLRLLAKANDRVDSAHDRTVELLREDLADLRSRLIAAESGRSSAEARATAAELALYRLTQGRLP
jgi:hypothetical protein